MHTFDFQNDFSAPVIEVVLILDGLLTLREWPFFQITTYGWQC